MNNFQRFLLLIRLSSLQRLQYCIFIKRICKQYPLKYELIELFKESFQQSRHLLSVQSKHKMRDSVEPKWYPLPVWLFKK